MRNVGPSKRSFHPPQALPPTSIRPLTPHGGRGEPLPAYPKNRPTAEDTGLPPSQWSPPPVLHALDSPSSCAQRTGSGVSVTICLPESVLPPGELKELAWYGERPEPLLADC